MRLLAPIVVLVALSFPARLCAQPPDVEPLGIAMEGYVYPHEVAFLPLEIEGQDVRMAYMDVHPEGAPRGTVLLLHGKNFFGAYWRDTIEALREAGYRVVVPDQVGFGKSSRPAIRYSFHLLADNTRRLLDELGVERVAVVGHSMGGMLATRFTLMFPDRVTRIVLENPIGLEDYAAKAPWLPTQQVYENELKATYESLKRYQERYYVKWEPRYEEYVMVPYRWTLSAEWPRQAWASALTSQMIFEQPVVHEFPRVAVPTLLVIGQEDRTALGRDRVQDETTRASMGQYPQLGRAAAEAIPNAKLVELEGVGHIPHFEAFDRWREELLGFLEAR